MHYFEGESWNKGEVFLNIFCRHFRFPRTIVVEVFIILKMSSNMNFFSLNWISRKFKCSIVSSLFYFSVVVFTYSFLTVFSKILMKLGTHWIWNKLCEFKKTFFAVINSDFYEHSSWLIFSCSWNSLENFSQD